MLECCPEGVSSGGRACWAFVRCFAVVTYETRRSRLGGCMFSAVRAGRTDPLRNTILAMAVLAVTSVGAQTAPYVIETVSTHADRVSGGDVLVKIIYNPVGQIGPLWITLNDRDA